MEWISVNDKMPEKYEEVIIYSDSGVVKSAIYMNDNKWNTYLQVKYWMPMPKPPKIEDEIAEEQPIKKKRGRPKKV